MKVKVEFDRFGHSVLGRIYEDNEVLSGIQSVLVYLDVRTDEPPIYCLNLPAEFADIIKAGIQCLSETSEGHACCK